MPLNTFILHTLFIYLHANLPTVIACDSLVCAPTSLPNAFPDHGQTLGICTHRAHAPCTLPPPPLPCIVQAGHWMACARLRLGCSNMQVSFYQTFIDRLYHSLHLSSYTHSYLCTPTPHTTRLLPHTTHTQPPRTPHMPPPPRSPHPYPHTGTYPCYPHRTRLRQRGLPTFGRGHCVVGVRHLGLRDPTHARLQ